MSLFYITGISGSGKSEVLTELHNRGYETHGTDEDGIAAFFNRYTGDKITRPHDPEQRNAEWRAKAIWKISRKEGEGLAERAKNKDVFLCGVVENDDEVWDLFSKVIALVVDEDTLYKRITTRTNNNFGKNPEELKIIFDGKKIAKND